MDFPSSDGASAGVPTGGAEVALFNVVQDLLDAIDPERGNNVRLEDVIPSLLRDARAAHALACSHRASPPTLLDYDCHKCFRKLAGDNQMMIMHRRIILCQECGNKRCPKASDHDLKCTGSNDPGQPGSLY